MIGSEKRLGCYTSMLTGSNYYMTLLTLQMHYMKLKMHSPLVLVAVAMNSTSHKCWYLWWLYYYFQLSALKHNNNYCCQRLSDQYFPDHKLLLLALVPSQSRKLRALYHFPRNLTRNDSHCLGKCSKRSCHMKLIFASSYLTPSVDAEYRNILRD